MICQVILDDVIGQLGYTYDLQNILDLATLFPAGQSGPAPLSAAGAPVWERAAHPGHLLQHAGLGLWQGRLSHSAPRRVQPRRSGQTHPPFYHRFFAKGQDTGRPVFRRRHPTLITPRDFDLSPYFSTIKFNTIASQRLDYRNIIWAEDADAEPAHPPPPPASAQPDLAASPVSPAPSVQGRAG